jgi:hypothetical protein
MVLSIALLIVFCFPITSLAQHCESLLKEITKLKGHTSPIGDYWIGDSQFFYSMKKTMNVPPKDTLKCIVHKSFFVLYQKQSLKSYDFETITVSDTEGCIEFIYSPTLFKSLLLVQIYNKKVSPYWKYGDGSSRIMNAVDSATQKK